MVHPSLIEARLGDLGFKHSRWFNAEIKELEHILMDEEKIIALACGRYFGSFALLVATDQRLLLIDKRVFFVTVQDTRYDMISEIDYNSQVYSASVSVYTLNKTHRFVSWRHKRELKALTSYVQRRIMEFRQQQPAQVPQLVQENQQPQPTPQPQTYQAAPPAPLGTQQTSTSFYTTSNTPAGGYHIKEHVGHVAHMVGSAAMAMHAPHPIETARRPFHPYIQGSLMTHRVVGAPVAPES